MRTPRRHRLGFSLAALVAWAAFATAQERQPLADPGAEAERLFPLPEYPPIGTLLSDWTNIPAPVFPREVEIVREIAGPTPITKGTKIHAVAWEHPILYVAKTAEAKDRIALTLDDTTMKAVMGDLYDDWRTKHRRSVLAKRSAKKRELLVAQAKAGNGISSLVAAETVTAKDPRMKPMVASIASNKYPELKRAEINSWQWLGNEQIRGQSYETGIISYRVKTPFGMIDTSAKALIKEGRVVNWIYTGTGEPVSTVR